MRAWRWVFCRPDMPGDNIKNVLIIGDFNSRHHSWGDHTTNDRGKQLATFISQHGLTCVCPNTNTFVSQNWGSIRDLALMKGKICQLYHSSSIDDKTELLTGAPTRGHLPIIHQFKSPSSSNKTPQPILCMDVDRTDWKAGVTQS